MSTPRSTHSGLKVLVVGMLIALPVLYVLSIGPAARLAYDGHLSTEPFLAFYGPMNRACGIAPPLRRTCNWYVGLWMPTNLKTYDDPTQR